MLDVAFMLLVTLLRAVALILTFAMGVAGWLELVNLFIKFALMVENWLVAAFLVLASKLDGVLSKLGKIELKLILEFFIT